MKCKDCGRTIHRLYKGKRLCGRCAIGYDYLYDEKNLRRKKWQRNAGKTKL